MRSQHSPLGIALTRRSAQALYASALMLLACNGNGAAKSNAATPIDIGAPASPAPDPGTPSSAASSAPDTTATSCASASECTYDTVPAVSTEADCTCTACPNEVSSAITRAELAKRKESFAKVCGEWSKSHGCAPRFCAAPAKLGCTGGHCTLAAGGH